MYIHKLKIGDIELDNNIILAPMAGITDISFRKICKRYGAPGLVYTEMISSKAIFYNDEKTKNLYNTKGEKRPVGIQIFGSDPDIMAFSAKALSKHADIIDINMGCPAPKVVKNGDGSKLLLNLDLVEEIVKKVVKETNKPVTVKIRKGWDHNSIVGIEVAKRIEKAGASAITIHGRTRSEYYKGKVDLDIIKKIKENVNITVIGNGDIKNAEDVKRIFEYTKVDGIMIGRANIGNPWLIGNIIRELRGERETEISLENRLKVIKEHIKLLVEDKGEYIGIREFRKQMCWYIKSLKDSSKIRDIVNKIETEDELLTCIEEYFNSL